jgi:hypothetical protein
MKFMRTMTVVGVAHFTTWWLTYGTLLMFDFDVLAPSQSPTILKSVYYVNSALMFPLLVGPIRAVMEHIPLVAAVALASCIWAGCLCMAVRACIRVRSAYVAPTKGGPAELPDSSGAAGGPPSVN